ncbi:MAG: hypothetical protein ABJ215_17810 [Alphaproteobacteria bacterium]
MIKPVHLRTGLAAGAILLGMVIPGAKAQTPTPTEASPNPFVSAGAAVAPDADGRYDLGALGYRPTRVAARKAADSFRVLFIGDSYIYGITTDDHTVPSLLENRLNTAIADRDIEIINLGVPSVGFPEYIAIYKFWSGRLEHDAVIFNIHAGTDWIDLRHSVPYQQLGDALVDAPDLLVAPGVIAAQNPGPPAKLHGESDFAPAIPADDRYESQVQFNDTAFLTIMLAWGKSYMAARLDDLKRGYEWARRLVRFADGLARSGTETLLVIAPSPLAASSEWRQRVATASSIEPTGIDPALPGALLQRMATRDGLSVPLLDLTGCLARQDRPDAPIFYGTNGHWGVDGNAAAAEILSAAVRQRWFGKAVTAVPGACNANELTPREISIHDSYLDQLDQESR